jgi:predicted nucleotidyltransferase
VCSEQEFKIIIDRIVHLSRLEFGSGLRDIILYGSYARGDARPDSDIDVMILVDGKLEEINRSGRLFSKLASDIDLEYGVCVSPLIKDADTFDYWKDALPFYRNIDTEGIRLSA